MTTSESRIAGEKFWNGLWVVLAFIAAHYLDWSFYQILTVGMLGVISWRLGVIVGLLDTEADRQDEQEFRNQQRQRWQEEDKRREREEAERRYNDFFDSHSNTR